MFRGHPAQALRCPETENPGLAWKVETFSHGSVRILYVVSLIRLARGVQTPHRSLARDFA